MTAEEYKNREEKKQENLYYLGMIAVRIKKLKAIIAGLEENPHACMLRDPSDLTFPMAEITAEQALPLFMVDLEKSEYTFRKLVEDCESLNDFGFGEKR